MQRWLREECYSKYTLFTQESKVCLNTDTGRKDTTKQLYGFGSQKHQLAINSVSLSCSGEKNPGARVSPTIASHHLSRLSPVCALQLNSRVKHPQGWVVLRCMRAKSTFKKKEEKSIRAFKSPFSTNCELSLISHLTNKQPKIYID